MTAMQRHGRGLQSIKFQQRIDMSEPGAPPNQANRREIVREHRAAREP
jgi:hypothetical protein